MIKNKRAKNYITNTINYYLILYLSKKRVNCNVPHLKWMRIWTYTLDKHVVRGSLFRLATHTNYNRDDNIYKNNPLTNNAIYKLMNEQEPDNEPTSVVC